MAIYHMQAKVVSRGSGRSAVAASAYMSCSRMYNDYDGIQHDYTRKHGLIYQEVMLPPMAPSEWNDREQLWNAVEETEKTKDSRLAREFVVALPVELDKDSNISLLQDFIKKNFVDMGMCADFAIHDTDGHNPHAHILLTVRPLNENGTWQYKTEKEYLCIKDGQEKGFTASEFKTAQKQGWEKQYRYKVGKKKKYLTSSVAQEKGYERIDKHPKSSRYGRQNPISEQWNSDEQLCIWRANWADAVNKMLARNQINATIDHRSFADQGITEQPTIHEGYIAQNMEKKGIIADRCEINRQIRADNKMLRELKAKVAKLAEAVEKSIPIIAETLEAIHNHIRENHIGNRSFIPVLNTDATVTVLNDTVIEQYIINLIHIFRTDLDGTGTGNHSTVGYNYVFARTVFFKLTTILQTDAVITRFDMAIGYAHILGMVYIDAVTVAYLQVIQDRDAIDGDIVATDEMNRPIGTVADCHITDHCFLYIDKRQYMRTGIKVGHRFQFIRVFQFLTHKGDTVSIYSSCSGDGYLFQILTINPHHAFTTIITESAQCIGSLIRIGKQTGIRFQMQFHK